MANPLSAEGVSDKDFAAAVGIAMGETGKRINPDEMAAVIDVAKNRLDGYDKNHHFAKEPTLHGVITARGQFDASNPRGSIGGRQKYDAGFNAIMNGAPVRADMRARYDAAVKQAIGVLSKDGPLRGTARNAEYFSSTAKKLSAKEARTHAKLGKGTGTKIGASTFYGPEHTKQFGARNAPTPARREDQYSKFGQEGTPRERLSQPFATEDYSQFGPLNTPREAIPPEARAPYSPASLDFGPDFTSPPSQARGPVTDPYGFSNINTAAEAAPGSFAGYGPNAFGALDQAPVDYGATYPDISAGLYDRPTAPMTNEDFNAIFGNMPDDATGSVRDMRMSAAPSSFAPAVNAAQPGGPYGFSSLQSLAPGPNAATIANDVTGYGAGGAFGSRAPSPGFDFNAIVNDTAWSGPGPANTPAPQAQAAQGPAAVPAESSAAFNSRMSDMLSPGMTGGMSPFQGTPLGIGQGIIDQGPYSSPLGPNPNSFAPANLAVSTQAPEIIGYEPGKTITRDVPNPAWSDWSRDYATKNAVQDAWLNADEDKFTAGQKVFDFTNIANVVPPEPAKTKSVTTSAPPTPIYSSPAVNVPAVNAQPALGSAIQAQPATWTPGMTQQAQQFSSLLGSIGGYGLQGVQGTFDTGFNLAGMGGGGYGNFGGGYDPGGYGGGGYGGTAPGDAGYGSDARSGSGNMGAGNLYQ